MRPSRRSILASLALALTPRLAAARPRRDPREEGAGADQGDDRVIPLLEPIRRRRGVPALAGALVTPEGPLAVAAVGERRIGQGPPVTAEDKFHIGSDTKAMTAALLATFVEEGALSWETSLADALPDLADAMHPGYRPATVEQLLAHRAGLGAESAVPGMSLLAMHGFRDPLPEQRTRYLRIALAEPPAGPPGAAFAYSNRNYIAAGAIAERLGRAPWEELIARRLFGPLGMTSAGFGPMAAPGRADQPWPHAVRGGRVVAVPTGLGADNPPLLGPSATVHLAMGDWARYLAFHLRAGLGEPAPLRPETFARLHARPNQGDYAFGWGFAERPWGGGTVLTHAGSNTMNYAVAWMAPRRGFAVLAATNQGGDDAERACDDASGALIGLARDLLG